MVPGINISSDGRFSPWSLAQYMPVGSLLRFVIIPSMQQRSYLLSLKLYGFRTLGVVAAESFEGKSNEELRQWIDDNLADYLDYVQLGNEWDHVSDSSETLSYEQLNARLAAFPKNKRYKLVLGGAVSGDATKLRGVNLSLVDEVAVHMYGIRPSASWYPNNDSGWGFGTVQGKLAEYRAETNLPIQVTEFGLKSSDFGETTQAEYYAQMAISLAQENVSFCLFCWSDSMVPTFGIMDSKERPKYSAQLYKSVISTLKIPPIEGDTTMAQFVLGFKEVADRLGKEVVGTPLEDQDYLRLSGGGEVAFQTTSTGFMYYSKKANKAFFVKGS